MEPVHILLIDGYDPTFRGRDATIVVDGEVGGRGGIARRSPQHNHECCHGLRGTKYTRGGWTVGAEVPVKDLSFSLGARKPIDISFDVIVRHGLD